MKSVQEQQSFSTKDSDSPTRTMESMKLNSPPVTSEKDYLQGSENNNGNFLSVHSFILLDTYNSLEAFLAKRQELIDIEKKMHFSYDLEATLTDEERIVDGILSAHKKSDGLKDDNFNIVLHDYFTHFDKMRNSNLYKIFDAMPKGGLHHVHTTAAPAVDLYIKLTYNDFVYFNEREKLFKVAPVRN